MFGRFLELAIGTADIVASVQFYERLGFAQLTTGDAWPHRYGVLGDGRIYLGLHEYATPARAPTPSRAPAPSPAPAFVLPGLEAAQARLHAAGMQPEFARFSPEELHWLRLRDPGANAVVLQEARTFSPAAPDSGAPSQSLCGYFLHLSLPQSDFARARAFWERGGFIALPEEDEPYPHMPLTSDALDVAFHQRRSFDAPLLVFECADLDAAAARLTALDMPLSSDRPRGVDPQRSLMLEAPEGTVLLMVAAAG
jgi:catechol 2,3-dioxygenase-like lactoylglutathione lyase family enzyme